ncbi:unnamed protein product, partial [Timema podura]|nr:unnamed protein product [Timema podura]
MLAFLLQLKLPILISQEDDKQFTCSFFMSQYGRKKIDLLQFRVRRLLDIGGGILFRGPP